MIANRYKKVYYSDIQGILIKDGITGENYPWKVGTIDEQRFFKVKDNSLIDKYDSTFQEGHTVYYKNPEDYIEKFIEVGADILTIHVEACKENTAHILKEIKERNIKAGLAINPNTNYKVIEDYINLIDMVCLMGVFPGFGGQKIIDSTFERCKGIRQIIVKNC